MPSRSKASRTAVEAAREEVAPPAPPASKPARARTAAKGGQSVGAIFNLAQRSRAAFPRCARLLSERRDADPDAFLEDFLRCLAAAVVAPRRSPGLDRALALAVQFATRLTPLEDPAGGADGASEADGAALAAHRTALEGARRREEATLGRALALCAAACPAADKAVRLRAVECVGAILEALPDECELDDEALAAAEEAVTIRLRDRIPAIRAAAVRGLARLVDPGEDGQYRDCPAAAGMARAGRRDPVAEVRRACARYLPACDRTLPLLLSMTRDPAEGVRAEVFAALAAPARVPLSALSLTQRRAALRRGLAERGAAPKRAAEIMARAWLAADEGGSPAALALALDAAGAGEGVATAGLARLMESGAIDAEAEGARGAAALEAEAVARGIVTVVAADAPPGTPPPSDDGAEVDASRPAPLDPVGALVWRVACERLAFLAHSGSSRAARAGPGHLARLDAAAAASAGEALDAALPSVADVVALARTRIAEGGGAGRAVARQACLVLARCADLADGASREAAAALVSDMLSSGGGCFAADGGPADSNMRVTRRGDDAAMDGDDDCDKDDDDDDDEAQPGAAVGRGGDGRWEAAAAELAARVHGAAGPALISALADADAAVAVACAAAAGSDGPDAPSGAPRRAQRLAQAAAVLRRARGCTGAGETLAALIDDAALPGLGDASSDVRRAAAACLGAALLLDPPACPPAHAALLRVALACDAVPAVRAEAARCLGDLALARGPAAADAAAAALAASLPQGDAGRRALEGGLASALLDAMDLGAAEAASARAALVGGAGDDSNAEDADDDADDIRTPLGGWTDLCQSTAEAVAKLALHAPLHAAMPGAGALAGDAAAAAVARVAALAASASAPERAAQLAPVFLPALALSSDDGRRTLARALAPACRLAMATADRAAGARVARLIAGALSAADADAADAAASAPPAARRDLAAARSADAAEACERVILEALSCPSSAAGANAADSNGAGAARPYVAALVSSLTRLPAPPRGSAAAQRLGLLANALMHRLGPRSGTAGRELALFAASCAGGGGARTVPRRATAAADRHVDADADDVDDDNDEIDDERPSKRGAKGATRAPRAKPLSDEDAVVVAAALAAHGRAVAAAGGPALPWAAGVGDGADTDAGPTPTGKGEVQKGAGGKGGGARAAAAVDAEAAVDADGGTEGDDTDGASDPPSDGTGSEQEAESEAEDEGERDGQREEQGGDAGANDENAGAEVSVPSPPPAKAATAAGRVARGGRARVARRA